MCEYERTQAKARNRRGKAVRSTFFVAILWLAFALIQREKSFTTSFFLNNRVCQNLKFGYGVIFAISIKLSDQLVYIKWVKYPVSTNSKLKLKEACRFTCYSSAEINSKKEIAINIRRSSRFDLVE